MRYIFPALVQDKSPKKAPGPLTLKQIIQKQSVLLHGEERRFTRFIPKVVSMAVQRVQELLASEHDLSFMTASKVCDLFGPRIESPISKLVSQSPSAENLQPLDLKVDQIRLHVNNGNWDYIKHS